jgi:hypothetical protein
MFVPDAGEQFALTAQGSMDSLRSALNATTLLRRDMGE